MLYTTSLYDSIKILKSHLFSTAECVVQFNFLFTVLLLSQFLVDIFNEHDPHAYTCNNAQFKGVLHVIARVVIVFSDK